MTFTLDVNRTYDNVTLYAGDNLNLVIGPNGTGKSALVCAIIIGLAGDPSATGRSGSLKEYIKFGCSFAQVTVELSSGTTQADHVITRKLTPIQLDDEEAQSSRRSDCKSEWSLNGKAAKVTQIKELISKLNIRVDNLCQFLPQERVVEFAKMNSINLLTSTLKALGDSGMYDNLVKLCDLSKQLRELTQKKNDLDHQTHVETNLNKRNREAIERIKEKKQLEEKVDRMKLKLPWLELRAIKTKLDASKTTLAETQQSLGRKKKHLKPLQQFSSKLESAANKHETKLRDIQPQLTDVAKILDTQDRKLKNLLENSNPIRDYKIKEDQEHARLAALERIKTQIDTARTKLRNLHDTKEDFDEQIADVNRKLQELKEQERSIRERINQAESEIGNQERVKKRALKNIEEIKNVYARRKEKLQQFNKSAYTIASWLENNKHKFKCTVYEPLMMQINVDDQKFMKHVETAIPSRDYCMFLCEDNDDLKSLQAVAREKGCKIAVASIANLSDEVPVAGVPIGQLRKYGFTNYLVDVISAPDAIKKYLCSQLNFHTIPIGTAAVDENIDSIRDRTSLSQFYSDSVKYVIRQSRYENGKITSSADIKPSRDLFVTVDKQQLATEQRVVDDCTAAQTRYKEQIESFRDQLADLAKEREPLSAQLSDLTRRKNYRKALELEIEKLEQQKRDKEAQRIDLESIKATLVDDSRKTLKTRDTELKKLIAKASDFVTVDQKCKNHAAALRALGDHIEKVDSECSSISSQFESLEQKISHLKQQIESEKEQEKTLDAVAKAEFRKRNIQLTNSGPSDELLQAFEQFSNDVETLKDDIAVLEDQISMIGTIEDDNLEQQFQDREELIRKKRAARDNVDQDLARVNTMIKSISTKWLDKLGRLISQINTHFSKHMETLKYGGEVTLDKHGDVSRTFTI